MPKPKLIAIYSEVATMAQEETEIHQLLEKLKDELENNTNVLYRVGTLYEGLNQYGDAFFFYWLAKNQGHSCEKELEHALKKHPHTDLIAKAKHLNLTIRLSVIDALTSIGNNSVIPILIELLADQVWQVRYRALTSLETIGNYFAAEYVHQVSKDPEEVVRQHVAICLGNLGHTNSIPCLFQMLQDPDAVVRQLSIRALGNFEPSSKIIEELKRMLHDKDAFTRKSARETLKKLEQPNDFQNNSQNSLPIHPF